MNKLLKKITILCTILLVSATMGFAQFKINPNGQVTITAQTQDWWSAISASVPTKSSCSYNLWSQYLNKDVFYVCAEGWLWTLQGGWVGSDSVLKKNIAPIEGTLQKVLRLQGVKYQYKDEIENEAAEKEKKFNDNFRIGFVAQEVEKVFPEVVKDMPDGTKAMAYTDLIAVLVEAIKEQQKMIETQQQRIETLEKGSWSNNTLKSNETSVQQFELSDNAISESMKLYQNAPNPFNERTTVKCYVPQNIQKVQLCIYNMQGVQVQCITITERGNVSIEIEAGKLSAGVYSYVLIGDGAASETKQMILTK